MRETLSILLVEDVAADAELVERELRAAGMTFTAKRVETRDAFIRALEDFGPDLILADYTLPSFEGMAALAIARERCPDVPFIFVSGTIGEELAIETLKSGATDYVLKGRLSRLVPAVRRALQDAGERAMLRWLEKTLREITHASLQIQEAFRLDERLKRLLQVARDVLELDRLNVLLADSEGRQLEAVASLGTDEPLEEIRVPIGPEGGGVAQSYQRQEAIAWDGTTPVPESLRLSAPYDRIAALRSRSFVILPLVVQGRTIGVIAGDRKHSRRPLGSGTLELFQLFATQAALTIEHARLYEAQRMASIQLEATVEARTRELQAANARLREATRRAEESSRYKSEFLANMSHELRTPLSAIIGFSELLARQSPGPLNDKQGQYVQHVLDGGRHLLTIISDVLDLSKIEAGKVELHLGPVLIRDLAESAVSLVNPQVMQKRLSLTLQVQDGLPVITADPLRLRQAFLNLLSNAVKFTPPGGSITVAVREIDDVPDPPPTAFRTTAAPEEPSPGSPGARFRGIEVSVQDTGIGIGADDLAEIFHEFTQVERSLTKQYEGAGLGLAIAKRLVELHGGHIEVCSPGLGRGTTFTVRLPLT
jgi:signal transduction histidine kinase/CheY-like chemotaxis protein